MSGLEFILSSTSDTGFLLKYAAGLLDSTDSSDSFSFNAVLEFVNFEITSFFCSLDKFWSFSTMPIALSNSKLGVELPCISAVVCLSE